MAGPRCNRNSGSQRRPGGDHSGQWSRAGRARERRRGYSDGRGLPRRHESESDGVIGVPVHRREQPLAADVLRQCASPVHTSGRRVYPAGLVCAAASGSERQHAQARSARVRESADRLVGWRADGRGDLEHSCSRRRCTGWAGTPRSTHRRRSTTSKSGTSLSYCHRVRQRPRVPPVPPSASRPMPRSRGVRRGQRVTTSISGRRIHRRSCRLARPMRRMRRYWRPATTYFWRVVARNAAGTTDGPVWTFTTAAPPAAPSAPVVVSPPDGTTGFFINTPLTWSSTGATSYDLAFGTVNPPTTTLVSGLTSPTYTPPTAINTTYFWRVTARNAGGTTVGPVWTFDTNVPPNLLVRDRFTGLSGTPLTAHAPEINVPGSAWSITGSRRPRR